MDSSWVGWKAEQMAAKTGALRVGRKAVQMAEQTAEQTAEETAAMTGGWWVVSMDWSWVDWLAEQMAAKTGAQRVV